MTTSLYRPAVGWAAVAHRDSGVAEHVTVAARDALAPDAMSPSPGPGSLASLSDLLPATEIGIRRSLAHAAAVAPPRSCLRRAALPRRAASLCVIFRRINLKFHRNRGLKTCEWRELRGNFRFREVPEAPSGAKIE